MAQVTGRVYVNVGGKRLASKSGAKLNFGGVEREGVMADTGPVGYQEKPVMPTLDCTIPHLADTSFKELAAIKDAAMSFDTDTGRSYALSGGFLMKPPELENGEVKLSFGALSCDEV